MEPHRSIAHLGYGGDGNHDLGQRLQDSNLAKSIQPSRINVESGLPDAKWRSRSRSRESPAELHDAKLPMYFTMRGLIMSSLSSRVFNKVTNQKTPPVIDDVEVSRVALEIEDAELRPCRSKLTAAQAGFHGVEADDVLHHAEIESAGLEYPDAGLGNADPGPRRPRKTSSTSRPMKPHEAHRAWL